MAPSPVPGKANYYAAMNEWSGYVTDSLSSAERTPVTISIASPAVVTFVAHGFTAGKTIVFATTGALPTGIEANKWYYVIAAGLTADTFQFSETYGGSAVNTSGTQSGVHSVYDEDWLLFQSYYDGEYCQYRLADLNGDTATYYPRADIASLGYRRFYVNSPGIEGLVQGYRTFPMGLVNRYVRQGDAEAKTAIENIIANSPWVNGVANSSDDETSRECAYALETLIYAPYAGITLTAAQVAWRSQLFEWTLGHADQWTVSLTAAYVRPFMVGITSKVWADYYSIISPDSRIITAAENCANYIWDNCWDAGAQAFNYTDRDVGDLEDLNPQPDLNMMVAPLFAWLWVMTGDTTWRTKGDQIFQGGIPVYSGGFYVSGAYLGTQSSANPAGKQYNQQLYWGPLYITWAESDSLLDGGSVPAPDLPPTVAPTPPPVEEEVGPPTGPDDCLGGDTAYVTYKTATCLSCRCEEESPVIICISAAKTCNGAPFIEGTLVTASCSADVCGNRQYSYYISYDDAQLGDGIADLTSSDITGIICRGCLTKYIDWKAPFFKTLAGANYSFVLPDTTPVPGAYLVVDSVDGYVITLAWGPPT